MAEREMKEFIYSVCLVLLVFLPTCVCESYPAVNVLIFPIVLSRGL